MPMTPRDWSAERFALRPVAIAEIRTDRSNRLVVVPRLADGEDFSRVDRAALGVAWDADSRELTSTTSEPWSHFDWFRHLVAAIVREYRAKLVFDAHTIWNLPDDLRRDIEAWHAGRTTRIRSTGIGLGDTNDAIWRYFDFPKFVSALDRRGLFFCRADLLRDGLEGSYTRRMLEFKSRYRDDVPPGRTCEDQERDLAVWAEDDRACRTCTYVNCWHVGEHESMAMWEGYGGGPYGVAIKSTIRCLDECLPASISAVNETPVIELGRVRYIDYSSTTDSIFSGNRDVGRPIENFFAKSIGYRHEQEFRAAFFNVEALRVEPRPDFAPGHWVPVDLQALVQVVRVSPLSPDWFTELVERTCQRFGYSLPLEPSAMIAPPIF